jgi:hypothetical protein
VTLENYRSLVPVGLYISKLEVILLGQEKEGDQGEERRDVKRPMSRPGIYVGDQEIISKSGHL